MTLEERSNLVVALARVLYVNGQSTDRLWPRPRDSAALSDSSPRSSRAGESWNFRPRDGDARLVCAVEANPTCSDMDRVASAMRAVEDLGAAPLTPTVAMDMITAISKTPPAPTWLFALAAGMGGVALAVLFGVQHLPAAALISVSSTAGAILRRGLAHYSTNLFLQPFCAAFAAGVIGALAVRYDASSMLRLVAVCPCMILVPGPHVLNGALDLMKGRISLGGARLFYAGLVVVAISTGLLVGLALLGVSLPVDPPGRH